MTPTTSCRVLILFAAALAFTSCTRQSDSEARTPAPDTTHIQAPSAPTSVPSPCTLVAALPGSLDSITRTAAGLLAGPDSCVTSMIDSLEAMAGRADGRAALVALDSLGHAADGYAGEAISSAMPKIFRRSPETVARYLIDSRSSATHPLRDALVAGFTLERPTQIDPAAQLKLDRHLFELVATGMKLAPVERAYLDSLKADCLAHSPG